MYRSVENEVTNICPNNRDNREKQMKYKNLLLCRYIKEQDQTKSSWLIKANMLTIKNI